MKIFICFCGLLMALSGRSQTGTGRPLQISIRAYCDGSVLPEGAFVPGPVDLLIHPEIETTIPVYAGDTVMVDFYCDGRKLCSGKAVWHNATVPPTRPGQAAPAYRIPAQFIYPNCLWTNVPVGKHVLSARAYGFHRLEAQTAPLELTALPPLPRRAPSGTHRLTGAQRPPLRPEQVAVFRASPSGGYQVVGDVTARADGARPSDLSAAIAELKKQAAFLGANGVILERLICLPGKPFSAGKAAFVLPQVEAAGRAVYVPPAARE